MFREGVLRRSSSLQRIEGEHLQDNPSNRQLQQQQYGKKTEVFYPVNNQDILLSSINQDNQFQRGYNRADPYYNENLLYQRGEGGFPRMQDTVPRRVENINNQNFQETGRLLQDPLDRRKNISFEGTESFRDQNRKSVNGYSSGSNYQSIYNREDFRLTEVMDMEKQIERLKILFEFFDIWDQGLTQREGQDPQFDQFTEFSNIDNNLLMEEFSSKKRILKEREDQLQEFKMDLQQLNQEMLRKAQIVEKERQLAFEDNNKIEEELKNEIITDRNQLAVIRSYGTLNEFPNEEESKLEANFASLNAKEKKVNDDEREQSRVWEELQASRAEMEKRSKELNLMDNKVCQQRENLKHQTIELQKQYQLISEQASCVQKSQSSQDYKLKLQNRDDLLTAAETRIAENERSLLQNILHFKQQVNNSSRQTRSNSFNQSPNANLHNSNNLPSNDNSPYRNKVAFPRTSSEGRTKIQNPNDRRIDLMNRQNEPKNINQDIGYSFAQQPNERRFQRQEEFNDNDDDNYEYNKRIWEVTPPQKIQGNTPQQQKSLSPRLVDQFSQRSFVSPNQTPKSGLQSQFQQERYNQLVQEHSQRIPILPNQLVSDHSQRLQNSLPKNQFEAYNQQKNSFIPSQIPRKQGQKNRFKIYQFFPRFNVEPKSPSIRENVSRTQTQNGDIRREQAYWQNPVDIERVPRQKQSGNSIEREQNKNSMHNKILQQIKINQQLQHQQQQHIIQQQQLYSRTQQPQKNRLEVPVKYQRELPLVKQLPFSQQMNGYHPHQIVPPNISQSTRAQSRPYNQYNKYPPHNELIQRNEIQTIRQQSRQTPPYSRRDENINPSMYQNQLI